MKPKKESSVFSNLYQTFRHQAYFLALAGITACSGGGKAQQQPCATDMDCPGEELCINNQCLGSCYADTDCPANFICDNSNCIEPGIVPETTKVLDEQALAELESVSEDGTLCFKNTSAYAANLNLNDIIVAGVSPHTPEGLLRKVTAVSNPWEQLCIHTTPAALNQAIQQMTFHRQISFSNPYAQESSNLQGTLGEVRRGEALDGIFADFDNVNITEGVYLDGGFTASLSADLKLEIRDWEVKYASFILTGEEKLELILRGEISASFSSETDPLTLMSFPTIVYWTPTIPSIPITFTPKLSAKFGAEASAGISAQVETYQTLTANYGIEYREGEWNRIEGVDHRFGVEEPTFEGNARIGAYATPRASLNVYGMAGPFAGIEGGIEAVLESHPCLNYSISAYLDAVAGLLVDINLFYGLLHFSADVDLGFPVAREDLLEYSQPRSEPFLFCDGNAVYSNDGCGNTTLAEECTDEQYCEEGACRESCIPEVVRECSGREIYQDDGCGNRELIETCSSGQHCSNGGCIDDVVNECTSHSSRTCYNGDAYWVDSCGNREGIADDCSSGESCRSGQCVSSGGGGGGNCRSHDSYDCYNDDVYWFNSCGDREELYEDCTSDEYCAGIMCLPCETHFERQCYDGDAYWHDSCGRREELFDRCDGPSQICEGDHCVATECFSDAECTGGNECAGYHCMGPLGCQPRSSNGESCESDGTCYNNSCNHCSPLPDGWIMCDCPETHGVLCHSRGWSC